MLDFLLLTSSAALLFGGAFISVYGLNALFLHNRFLTLRPATLQNARYAGVVMLISVAAWSFITLSNPLLRIGLLAGSLIILIVGTRDEQRPLSAQAQFIWQVVIATVVVAWGWTIPHVSNPWGVGVINLHYYALGSFWLPGGLLAVGWLLLLMNAINWLDGVDGLASSVGFVALVTLAALSLLPATQDQSTLLLALIGAGSILGFLVWNFPPARVFLGTTGSWYLGLYIGMVAIIGGGKVVTTLLVLALPLVDVLAVILQRLIKGQAPWRGDDVHHLHHHLLRVGMKPRTITLIATILSVVLGSLALLLQTAQKIIALGITAGMLGIMTLALIWLGTTRHVKEHPSS